ncbi:hypothetical protein AB0L63_20535 [Nocardia sp. NPDC051990]
MSNYVETPIRAPTNGYTPAGKRYNAIHKVVDSDNILVRYVPLDTAN